MKGQPALNSALLLVGCLLGLGVPFAAGAVSAADAPPAMVAGAMIEGESVWSGEVLVKSPVLVGKGATLRILPGTKVVFDLPQEAAKAPWVLVEGAISVEGEKGRKALFTSASGKAGEEGQDMFSVQKAARASFSHAVFEHAGWAVHLHETGGAAFTGCEFRSNYGGVRFKSDGLAMTGNLFTENTIGVRAINSASPRFTGNTFRGNLTGIFLREGVEGALVKGNDFDDVEYDIKLGEGQTFDVDARGNSWKAAREGGLGDLLYDGHDSAGLGMIILTEGK